MHGFKELSFKYTPGAYAYGKVSKVLITINEKSLTYEEIYFNDRLEEVKSPLWKAKTNLELFSKLTEKISHALYSAPVNFGDSDETLISAKMDNGNTISKKIPGSFYDSHLDFIADILVELLKGTKIPAFLLR